MDSPMLEEVRVRHNASPPKNDLKEPFKPDTISSSDVSKGLNMLTKYTSDKMVPKNDKKAPPKPDKKPKLPEYTITADSTDDDKIKNLDIAHQVLKNYRFGRNKNTLYHQNCTLEYEAMLWQDFDVWMRSDELKQKLPKDMRESLSSYRTKEVYAWLLGSSAVRVLPDLPDSRYLAVANGVIDLKKRRLLLPSEVPTGDKSPVLFNRLNVRYVDYTLQQWKASQTLKFLRRLADPNCVDRCVEAILYIVGKICSNDRRGKNLYYLYGASNNGKSVLAAYLQEILGPGNFGNLALKELTGQFSLINLRHALVNISTDEETEAWNSATASIIKRITGHDTLMVDVKFERRQQFRPYTILLCMSNSDPKFSKELDAGGAISKRLFLIPTGPTVEDEDQNDNLLQDELLPEKDLFFSVALNYFMTHDHPAKIVDVETIVHPTITPKELFTLWCNECVESTGGSEVVLASELYNNYRQYTKNAPGASRMTERAFQMEIAIRFGNQKSSSRFHNRSCYIGLKLLKKIYQPFSKSTDTAEDSNPAQSINSADDPFGGW